MIFISSYKLDENLIATFCYEWSVFGTCIRSSRVLGPVNIPDTGAEKLSWTLIDLKEVNLEKDPVVNLFTGEYFIG